MELRTLRYFITVAELLNFSAAAENLKISQSAVSRQILLLEDELGVPLFDRVGRKVFLTQAGSELLDHAYEVQKGVSSLRSKAAEIVSGTHGVVRIGATPQTLETLLTPILTQFQKRLPEARILLVENGSAKLVQEVERGNIDLVVGALDGDHELESRPLFPLVVLVALPKDHRLRKRKSIEVAELSNEQLLLLRKDFMTRKLFDGACSVARVAPRVLIESASPHCLLALVQGGLGLAIIPSTVHLAKGHPPVVPLTQNGCRLGIQMRALWDPRRHVPPLVRSFIEDLAAYTKNKYPGSSFHVT